MRIKDCKGCLYCERLVWVQQYQPENYHQIGFSHAYHWCRQKRLRCAHVKACSPYKTEVQ